MAQTDAEGGQALALNVPVLTKAEEGEEKKKSPGCRDPVHSYFWFTTGPAVKQKL